MFTPPSATSACASTARLTGLSLRSHLGAQFHRRRFRSSNRSRVDLSLHHLTQDELLAKLEFHMAKIQEWSEKEEVAKLNKQSHCLAVKKVQELLDPNVEPTWMNMSDHETVAPVELQSDATQPLAQTSVAVVDPVVVSDDCPADSVGVFIPHDLVILST